MAKKAKEEFLIYVFWLMIVVFALTLVLKIFKVI